MYRNLNFSTLCLMALIFSMTTFLGCGSAESESGAAETHTHEHAEPAPEAEADHAEEAKTGKEYTSAYICPMHCAGSGSDEPGTCPVCGMDYVANAEMPAQEGHDHEGHDHDDHQH
ncbi:heavy metal-binding domain-containing protein [Pontibacter sp. G13]|uniref:heavy metal-binding domain-containing protein n=1 Tax=Pontibacter sp. G13 TaxID=3074898 RepID=UPI00288B3203|nr:heavy metal-binding domain-containing protein [Pontibacter sp. G13]WNJ16450.1 heavy metal-binding domain-containing protein [Pontibacter sp. G13]